MQPAHTGDAYVDPGRDGLGRKAQRHGVGHVGVGDRGQRQQKVAAQRQHEERHRAAYLTYLREQEDHLRREHPEAYEPFAQKEEQQKAFITRCGLSGRALAAFAAEEARLTRLRLFFAGHAEHPVLDFWGWDETLNTNPLRERGTTVSASYPTPRHLDAGAPSPLPTAAADLDQHAA